MASSSSPRADLLRMGGFLAALLLVTGLVVLAMGGDASDGSAGTVEGRITTVNDRELVLQPEGGGAAERFVIRPIDVRRLDIPHLQTHASQGLPSRVIFEREGAERHVVRVDDLPPPPIS